MNNSFKKRGAGLFILRPARTGRARQAQNAREREKETEMRLRIIIHICARGWSGKSDIPEPQRHCWRSVPHTCFTDIPPLL